MYDELHAICDAHGVFLRHEALELGHTDRTLARAVKAGVLHRVRHGSYVHRPVWDALPPDQRHLLRARAVLRTARTETVLSHSTAVIAHGAPAWELPLAYVHLTRTDRCSGRKEAGVAKHRGALMPNDVVEVNGLRVTSPTRTVLDITTICDMEHCLPVVDHLLHHGMTSKPALRRGAVLMTGWPGSLTTDLVIRLSNPRCESVGESRTHYMLWRAGIPAPETNLELHDPDGRLIGRVDFAWPSLGVFLEFDGKEKYLKHRKPGESVVDAVRREKKREERICRVTGWRCIRITWADLHHPERTAAHIASVLAGGPVYV
jgi:hypothetical protein